MNPRSHVVAVAVACAVSGATLGSADDTNPSYCNAFITSLPYTITQQGHYCFNRNLSTAIAGGAAITVNANFVVLDLNNFKLGGGSAGLGTEAAGVLAVDRQNVTVRNGNIRGFRVGIQFAGPLSAGHVVENMLLDFNTVGGAVSFGSGTVMRRNTVVASGGSTVYPDFAYGLATPYGFGLHEDNVVASVDSATDALGIFAGDYGIAQRNSVYFEPDATAETEGVVAHLCRDNNVLFAYEPVDCIQESGTLGSSALPPPALAGSGRAKAAGHFRRPR
jgi:hypothetical protein